MTQRFIKGYTNNHLTWVMVDATDFATPESALSAATTIKIYGKVKGATGVNFVSSGTGSLTNDIQHVGASATGIYTIALAKADLSDASQAWYDQYVITLSATGAARQTLIVDGGIMESFLSAAVSDAHSAAILGASHASDAASQALLASSRASDAHSAAEQANSRVLLVQSRLSDLDSRLVSDVSDIRSMLTALSDAISDSQSDLRSFIGAGVPLDASTMSDLRSAINAGPAATITPSDISDIASAVWAAKYTTHSAASSFGSLFSDVFSRVALIQSTASDAHSAAILAASHASDATSQATLGSSRALLIQSRLSDFNSVYTSDISDIRSMLTALSDAISDSQSDLRSFIGAGVPLDASTMSDIRSAINAGPAATVTGSDISDIASAVWAAKYTVHSAASSFGSLFSDVFSRVALIQSTASDAHSAAILAASHASDAHSAAVVGASYASDAHSAALLAQSYASDAHSAALLAASAASDVKSMFDANRSEPGQGTPSASITALAKLDYLYKAWRNRHTQTASEYALYADDGTTKDQKATVSDDGTTFDRGEVATGA